MFSSPDVPPLDGDPSVQDIVDMVTA